MALFTDGTISTLEELRGYESGFYDVASIEGIDLSQKLVLAQQELGVELTARLFREQPEQLGRVVVTPPLQLVAHLSERWLSRTGTPTTATSTTATRASGGSTNGWPTGPAGTCSRPGSG